MAKKADRSPREVFAERLREAAAVLGEAADALGDAGTNETLETSCRKQARSLEKLAAGLLMTESVPPKSREQTESEENREFNARLDEMLGV